MRFFVAASGAAIAFACVLSGCASIARGTSDQLVFESTPSGAEVRTWLVTFCDRPCYPGAEPPPPGDEPDRNIAKAGPACVTPCTLPIKRNEKVVVHFTKAGFEKESVLVYGKVAANGAVGVLGNAVIGGVAGLVVDTATGAALDMCPNPVAVTLRPVQQARRGQPAKPSVEPAPRDLSAACTPPPPSGAAPASSS